MYSINNYKYTHCIQSNGSIVLNFDYFSYGFKITEVHYFNFFFEDNYFFSKRINYYNFSYSYFLIFNKKFLVSSSWNNNLNIKKNVNTENVFYFKKSLFQNYNNIITTNKYISYNNININNILNFFKKKIVINIFFNF